MLGTLAGLLLFYTIQNVINQVGTLTSHVQQMVIGAFVIAVVAAQTYLARKRTDLEEPLRNSRRMDSTVRNGTRVGCAPVSCGGATNCAVAAARQQ